VGTPITQWYEILSQNTKGYHTMKKKIREDRKKEKMGWEKMRKEKKEQMNSRNF